MEKLKIEIAREKYINTMKHIDAQKKKLQTCERKAFNTYLKEISAGAEYDNKVLKCIVGCFGSILRGPAFGKRETLDSD